MKILKDYKRKDIKIFLYIKKEFLTLKCKNQSYCLKLNNLINDRQKAILIIISYIFLKNINNLFMKDVSLDLMQN
ncbi:uncharacterized protein T551_01187 [Pneumocystis jirovecii RU7]|uniref:Uncharacterized protein n=1 Tax=Pneumocystis jirovecii (strain RU7) TaxID=1408657 RepID=A0A0W4ZRW0_PNEJ7|nr:uncharacterized protein T551_01187 [Pneumocystis jirovecii RU7]KTW31114.1 hypothetical protein T551_01187 [Pneumocystis jirovecii RU7]